MSKVKVGVVGVGHIGKNHARVYSEIEQADFVAVFDANESAAIEIAEKFGARAARSLDEFIELVDAATIATPTSHHFEIAKKMLERGKHLLVEKPITDNTAQ